MPDVNIKISVDPATGAVAVTSDTGEGPAPGDIFPGAPSAADAGAAPGPASGIMGEDAADFGGEAPAPLDPSQLGAAVGGEQAAVGVAAPPPEDLEVLTGEAADAAEQGAPEPMPLTDLEAEADKKPKAKAKPKQARTKKS